MYIDLFPKPLLDDLLRNRWVPIVGAGLSRNAQTPAGLTMPLWSDLGKLLAAEVADYDFTNPLDAISTYAHEHSRAKLAERLTDLLLVDRAQPSEVHRAFCSIPFDLVCTTNLEFLLEAQYTALSRYCRPIVDEDQLSIATREAGVTLFKVHGDVHHPQRMVVTEDDYDGFLNSYPLVATFLANLLITRTAVLVGYSLDDPDFRQIWRVITARLGQLRRPAYVILVGGSMADVARYKRRNVNVINLPGSAATRAVVLTAAFDELAEYWRKNLVRVSTVTAEEPLQQLVLPTEATSRLCFFSVPLALNAYYKERVYPLAQSAGLVPVTADEVVSPGENLLAKTDALLEHAEAIVVDTGSPWTWSEVGWLIRRARGKRILVVVEEGSELPGDLRDALFVRRPKVPIDDAVNFERGLAEWLIQTAEALRPNLVAEPQRLLDQREYRAAVIAAITLLESRLRYFVDIGDDSRNRPLSIGRVADIALKQGVLLEQEYPNVRAWIHVRNGAVHTQEPVNAKAAKTIVAGVQRILDRLNAPPQTV